MKYCTTCCSVSRKSNSIIFSVACLLLFSNRAAYAQTSSYEELQAAYIYNFAKYVKWPTEGNPTFVIGIYGELEIMEFLQKTLDGKKIKGEVIELREINSVEEMMDVSIVYVPESGSKNMNALIDAVRGKSILIVTEDDLIKKGAMISFVVEDDKLRFKLKKNALAEAGLVASEGLLKLAIQL